MPICERGRKLDSYRELNVYKKAYEQAKRVYELTKKFPKEEAYGMTSQMRRASVGIPLCIAEGYGKQETGKETHRFLSMARGSSVEMDVLLDFSKDFGYISESEYQEAKAAQETIGKMLTGLMKSLKEKHNLS